MSQDYGRRIVCNALHTLSADEPERLFALQAKGQAVSEGFHTVSFQQVARATNWMSLWLQQQFDGGNRPSNHSAVCYVGSTDIRYSIITYAALQCGYKIFLASPRNTNDVTIALLQQLDCTRFVYAQQLDIITTKLRDSLPKVKFSQMPDIEDLIAVPETSYSYCLSYQQNFKDPAILLHSSGSTGMPKIINWTHGALATLDVRDFPGTDQKANVDFGSCVRSKDRTTSLYHTFPICHSTGIGLTILGPIWFDRPVICAPASRPPSGQLIAQILRECKPECLAAPPSILEQLATEPDSEQLLQKVRCVMYMGGPLSDETGSKLARCTRLVSCYGATEAMLPRQLEQPPGEWSSYIEFNPNEGFRFEKYADDLYELILPVSRDRERTSALCHTLPHLSEWRSKDLFRRHPDNPSRWKFTSRADDILVFSSGEKLFALPMEVDLTAKPHIRGALVVGQGQKQSGLLIELDPESKFSSDADAIEQLWPSIDTANALLPGHGRVSKNMVIIAKASKPFKRTVKDTVIRRITEDLYKDEIRDLYSDRHEAKTRSAPLFAPSVYRSEDIRLSLRSIFQRVLNDVEIEDDQSLYSLGLDSIKTAEVVGEVKTSLRAARPNSDLNWVTLDTVYTSQTLSRLTSIICTFLNEGKVPAARDRLKDMEGKIAKYTKGLAADLPFVGKLPQSQLSIAVTGTTGFLGRYLVGALASIPQVSRIYCLNRSSTAREQYYEKNNPSSEAEIIFMTCKFADKKLGLSDDDYSQLVENCSLVLLNAWAVNFSLPLDGFDDNIQSVRNFIDLSLAARLRPRLHFISTFATAGVRGFAGDAPWTVPEGPLEQLDTTLEVGYAESKRVSERILEIAATQSQISVTLVRLGQLVPETGGALPPTDNLVDYLKMCRDLKLVTADLYPEVNWVPVHTAARVLADIVQNDLISDAKPGFSYFNLVNPQHRPWSDFWPILDSWCGTSLQRVDAAEWVERVAASEKEDLDQSIKLRRRQMLRLWQVLLRRSGPSYRHEHARLDAISGSMTQLSMIEPKSLETWLPHIDV